MSRCHHKAPAPIRYAAFVADGEARHARGERQACCSFCGKWHWPDAFDTRTDYLEAMDWADVVAGAAAGGKR